MRITISNEEDYIEFIRECGKSNIISGMNKAFNLASERALETMALCGIREKPSRGKLSAKRTYIAPNKERIHLFRPKINDNCLADSYEEITQDDLDILRAVNTKFVEEVIKYKFEKDELNISMPSDSISERLFNDELKTISDLEVLELIDNKYAVVITTGEIRKKLQSSISSSDIMLSVNKLSTMSINGNYMVRTKNGAKPVNVTGNLFNYSIIKEKLNGRIYICFIFNTIWGMLYLNNIHMGNISWINNDKYLRLNIATKNIINIVMSFQNKSFFRKVDDMLKIFNIKVSKNRERAIKRLEIYLNELESIGLIDWKVDRGTYYIEHRLIPTKPSMDMEN